MVTNKTDATSNKEIITSSLYHLKTPVTLETFYQYKIKMKSKVDYIKESFFQIE